MTRLLGTILAISIALSAPAFAGAIQKCPAPKGSLSTDHTDKRIREIFARVIEKSQLKDSFALCKYSYYVPMIARLYFKGKPPIVVVSLPYYVSQFTDDEVEGVFGHELGHVPSWDRSIISMSDEKDADAQGRDWVGVTKIYAFLEAMKRSMRYFPRFQRRAGRHEIAQRKGALIDPIIVAESRT